MSKKEKKPQVTTKTRSVSSANDGFFKRYLYQIIIFSFSFVLFANSIPNDYNLDDELVTRNHKLTSQGISAIPPIFTSNYYSDASGYAYEYRPVVLTTFAIEHEFFGDNPHVSHFFNVLLYAFCCVMLFNTLRRIWPTLSPLFLLGAALLFVAHPSHTEVVDNIKSRDEILALMFSLLALNSGLSYVRTRKWWQLLLLPLFMLLALMNKLSILSFAVIIPITVILFASATLTDVIVLSVLLIVPSLVMLSSSNYLQKAAIGLAILTGNILLYAFANWEALLAIVKSQSQASQAQSDTDDGVNPLYKIGTGIQPLFQGLSLPAGIVAIGPMILSITLGGVFVASLYLQSTFVILSSALALLLIGIFGNEKYAWWANTLFFFVSPLALLQFQLSRTMYDDLVACWLAYHLFFGKRSLAIPALLAFLLLLGITFYDSGSLTPLIFILAFFGLRYRYALPLTILCMVFAVIGPINYFVDIMKYRPILLWVEYFGGAFAAIMLVFVLVLKRPGLLANTYKVLGIALLLTFQLTQGNINNQVAVTKYNANNYARQTGLSIAPTGQNRPLDFIEQPVTSNDPLTLRIGTSAEILFHYLYKTILPYPLSFYYGYKFIVPMKMTEPMAMAGLALYALLLLLTLWLLWRKNWIPGYALLFYLVSIVVFSNFSFPVPGLLADRFMLIPSLGWCIVLVWVLFKLFKVDPYQQNLSVQILAKPVLGVLAGVMLLYSGISFGRNSEWKDYVTLFSHDVKYVDNSAQAHNLLALHLMEQTVGEKNGAKAEEVRLKAIEQLQKAIEIYPDFFNASFDLGRISALEGNYLYQLGKTQQAEVYFNLAKQGFSAAMRLDTTFTDAVLQKGYILDQEGKLDSAKVLYKEVIAKRPTKLEAYTNLSFVFFRQQEYDSSLAVNREALKNMPNTYEILVNISRTFMRLNQRDSTLVYLEKAYAINPKDQGLVQVMYEEYNKAGNKEKAAYYGRMLGFNP